MRYQLDYGNAGYGSAATSALTELDMIQAQKWIVLYCRQQIRALEFDLYEQINGCNWLCSYNTFQKLSSTTEHLITSVYLLLSCVQYLAVQWVYHDIIKRSVMCCDSLTALTSFKGRASKPHQHCDKFHSKVWGLCRGRALCCVFVEPRKPGGFREWEGPQTGKGSR